MAIQIPNAGTGNGATGDNEFVLWSKVINNFSDQTNAASRLLGTGAEQVPLSKNIPSLLGTAATKNVGTATGNVMEVGAFGIGGTREAFTANALATSKDGFIKLAGDHGGVIPASSYPYSAFSIKENSGASGGGGTALVVPSSSGSATVAKNMGYRFVTYSYLNTILESVAIYTTGNTSIVNGNLKPSSPVVKIHTDSLELNDDAERMGVTLNKRGVGDYLLQNTTGLRNDGGWRIELPQDVNGNPYFAIAYNELENNDIEVKTYKRIFDMNTFMFVPDLDSPVDIKEGRSIAIRFNDLPTDILDDTHTEV